jgi:hypothetical protein
MLGEKISIRNLIIILVLGIFIGMNVWCSCSGGLLEGFQAGKHITMSALDYTMSNGVPVTWKDKGYVGTGTVNTPDDWYNQLKNNVGGRVPLPEGELLMFAENTFDPSCCPSTYSNSSGCACISGEQMQYLNERGGNRTSNGLY